MATMDLVYTDLRTGKVKLELDCHWGDADPFAMIAESPWEVEAEECLTTVFWVRDDAGRILAVGTYASGSDPLHPDLIVTAGKETRVYRHEESAPSYRARLVNVTRLPTEAK